MTPCPPLDGIHGKAFWWQFEELVDFINVETYVLVVT
jgi:hypothetical protein